MNRSEQAKLMNQKILEERFGGDVEAMKAWRRENASKGGKAVPRHKRTFFTDRDLASKAGKIGRRRQP